MSGSEVRPLAALAKGPGFHSPIVQHVQRLISRAFTYIHWNITWSSRDTIEFKKLFRVQKKALRLITGKSWQTHSAPLFKSMRILRLHDANTVQVACFVYGVIHNTLLARFHNYFVTNRFIGDHFTRHNEDIHILQCNTNVRVFCIKIYDAKIWNSVPMNIKSAPSINIFKHTFRSHLIDLYN